MPQQWVCMRCWAPDETRPTSRWKQICALESAPAAGQNSSAEAEPMTSLQPKARLHPGNLLGILSFLRKYPGRVALCLGLLLVNISIEMTLPQILGNAISGLRRQLADHQDFLLHPFVVSYFVLISLRAAVGLTLGPIRSRTIQTTLGDIRAAIYNALQRLTFTYHDQIHSGELISRATTDVWRLQDFLFACLLLSVDIAVSLLATTTLIFWISPALGAVALLTMVPTVALIAFYASKLQPQWRNIHDLHGAMTTVIQENIAGVRVVKAFAKEQTEINKFRGRKESYLGSLLDTVNYWAARVPRAQFLYGLSTPLALRIGGRQVIQGELPIGDLAKVIFYLMAISHRVGMVGQFTNIVQNAGASAERILEIIHEPQTIKSGARPLPPGRGEIVFDHVSFGYSTHEAKNSGRNATPQTAAELAALNRPTAGQAGNNSAGIAQAGSLPPEPGRDPEGRPARPTLHEISFVARPGQTLAIVGPTGSGKTTLVNLIPRFYEATSGRVLIDGVDVRELNLTQ